MRSKIYKNKEIVFSPEDPCNTLGFLREGEINVCKYTKDGDEIILNTLKTGESFGLVWIFGEKNYPYFGVAKGRVEVIEKSKGEVLKMLTNTDFGEKILSELSEKILNLSETNELLRKKKMKERLALYILLKYKKHNKLEFDIDTKVKIGKELNSSREVISKNFSILEKEGYIKFIQKNRILICNLKRLKEVAE